MKAAYKWRLENGIYGYLIDETGNSEPFSYSLNDYTRLYYGGGVVTGTNVDDGTISTIVSKMTKNEYINQFNEFKNFINEVYPQVSLLDVNFYYDIENDECTNSASSLKCSATDIIFEATAVSGEPINAVVTNVQPHTDNEDALRYRIDFTIPPGEQGPVGATPNIEVGSVTTTTIAAGSDANVTVTRDPESTDEEPVFDFEFDIPRGEGSLTVIGGQNIETIITGTTGDEVVINAIGYRWDSEKESFAEGNSSTASGDYSHAEGYETKASGNYSHAEGESTLAFGIDSHAEGDSTIAYGYASHAEGQVNTDGIISITGLTWESGNTIITGNTYVFRLIHIGNILKNSNSEYRKIISINEPEDVFEIDTGFTTSTTGATGVLYKINSISYGKNSHVEGQGTIASGDCSHAEGSGSIASGMDSHAEGETSISIGFASHAEGRAVAKGEGSHAEGTSITEINASHAHAEGETTLASGQGSHAEGIDTVASGYASHAGGYNTIANQNHMTAIGKYNKTYNNDSTTTLFVVGDGEANSRHNAFEVINEVGANTAYSTRATVNSFDNVLLGMPIGSVVLWGGESSVNVPEGWLLCTGGRIKVETASSTDFDFMNRGQHFKAKNVIYRPLCKVIQHYYGFGQMTVVQQGTEYSILLPNIPPVVSTNSEYPIDPIPTTFNMNYIIKYK